MRIGFLSLPVPGHLNPMTALARTLQSHGHDVVFMSLADVAPFVEAAGLPFVSCSERAYPAGSLGKLVRRLSELSGEDALHFTVLTLILLDSKGECKNDRCTENSNCYGSVLRDRSGARAGVFEARLQRNCKLPKYCEGELFAPVRESRVDRWRYR